MTTAQDQQSRALWIDPNDKSRAQYLPHIGEAVLFKHAGRVYTGKHTGGSFKADYPLGKSFTTWDCVWMYPSELYTAAQVLAMGRVPPGWQAVPVEPTSKQVVLMAGAILHQRHGTADTRHPCWPQAVEQAEKAYRAAIDFAPRPPAAQEEK